MSVEDVAGHMDEGLAAMQRVEALSAQRWRNIVGSSGEFYEMGRSAVSIRIKAGIIRDKLIPDLTGVPLKECETAADAYGVALEGSDRLPDFEDAIEGSTEHFKDAATIGEAYKRKLLKIQQAAAVLGQLIGETEPLHKQLLHEISGGGKAAKPVITLDQEYRAGIGIAAGGVEV